VADDRVERGLEIAAFRYRLIAEALELSSEEAVGAVLHRIAAAAHSDPWGRPFQCKTRTLWRYLRAYRRGGLLALRPAVRKDRGELRALRPEILSCAVLLRQKVRSRSPRR
jgi:putative transposase